MGARSTAGMVLALLMAGLVAVAVDPSGGAAQAQKKQSATKKVTGSKQGAAQKQPAGPPARQAFTEADQRLAAIPGIPDARVWGDDEQEFARVMPPNAGPWLILSEGGQDGAFGAGLLSGWSASGNRPEFPVVTGVSAGALMSPFAFVGSRLDNELRDQYTKINAGDIFEAAGTPESLLDTWPLKQTISKYATPQMLAAIAAEHARGRRLLVVTTNLDAGRPVVWNMGVIAARGDEASLKLFRDVLVASSAVPGMFPPVYIEVEAKGRRFQEMHADGGMNGPFYVAPESVLSGAGNFRLPATALYIVVNGKLKVDFGMPERSTLNILGRSIAVTLATGTRAELAVVHGAAKRAGIGFNLAYVDPGFDRESRGVIDPEYMKALFDVGVQQGKSSTPFYTELPGLARKRATVGP